MWSLPQRSYSGYHHWNWWLTSLKGSPHSHDFKVMVKDTFVWRFHVTCVHGLGRLYSIMISFCESYDNKPQSHSRSLQWFYCHKFFHDLFLSDVSNNDKIFTQRNPLRRVMWLCVNCAKSELLLINMMMTINIWMHYMNYGFPTQHNCHLNSWKKEFPCHLKPITVTKDCSQWMILI